MPHVDNDGHQPSNFGAVGCFHSPSASPRLFGTSDLYFHVYRSTWALKPEAWTLNSEPGTLNREP